MSETIEDRLNLLLESEQLSPGAAQTTQRLLTMVEEWLGRPLAGAVAIAFVTHITLSLERLLRGEPLEATLPDALLKEVQEQEVVWQFAERLARIAREELGTPLPASEVGYVAAHLGALLEESSSL